MRNVYGQRMFKVASPKPNIYHDKATNKTEDMGPTQATQGFIVTSISQDQYICILINLYGILYICILSGTLMCQGYDIFFLFKIRKTCKNLGIIVTCDLCLY